MPRYLLVTFLASIILSTLPSARDATHYLLTYTTIPPPLSSTNARDQLINGKYIRLITYINTNNIIDSDASSISSNQFSKWNGLSDEEEDLSLA
jgi:hypothetical protein